MPFFRSTKLLPIENNSNCIRSWCLSSVGITKLSAHTVTQQHELRGGLHLHYLERERRSEWLSVCRRGMSNTQKKNFECDSNLLIDQERENGDTPETGTVTGKFSWLNKFYFSIGYMEINNNFLLKKHTNNTPM